MAPGFEPVAAEFRRNFAECDELGAAFAAVVEGRTVIDVWGGVADPVEERRWERDSLQLIFSGAKGLVAACVLLLIDRGELDLDARVCEYWPEFAAAGKEGVTVRQVVTHSAGLPGLATPVSIADILDARRMAELLAAQPQFDDLRAFATYHGRTYGWLCGELVRRVDGRPVGRFFAEEFAAPLGLHLYLGVPPAQEPRVTRCELGATWASLDLVGSTDEADRDELRHAIWDNPQTLTPDSFPANDPAYRRAEIPAVNAIGTARSVARFYASLDRLISAPALGLGASPLVRRSDALFGGEQNWGVGFELQTAR
ncbi:MAG TPA: serine hydrolase domain-containing protein, partial [Solirubrobacterales bacterium]|nr:serine hydrolase domain-containing protein [Solirubrobacterales bacterium]